MFSKYTQKTTSLYAILLVLLSVCVLIYIGVGAHIARAAFNPEINYQGKLTNAANVAVEDGIYHMKFRLYTAASGGTLIAEENRSFAPGDRVNVINGLFSVMLGSSTSLTSVDFNQDLWLEVQVGGTASSSWETLSPRKPLGAVPAAFESDKLDGLDSTQFVRTDTGSTIASTSASTLLTINQSGTGNILDLQDGGATVFTVRDGGNVGIGTSSPFTKLSVAGSTYIGGDLTATGTVTFTGLTDGCVNVTSGVLGSTACGGAGFGKTWEITNGALSPTTTLGIGVYASSTIGAGTTGQGLTIFGSATTTGAAAFRGTIKTGLGSADSNLELGDLGSGNRNSYVDLVGDDTYTDYGARFVRFAGANGITRFDHRGTAELNFRTSDAAPMTFSTNSTEYMRILSTGLIGIGTTSPQSTLQVNSANISGTSIAGSTITAAGSNLSVITTSNAAADVGGMIALGGARNTDGTNPGIFGSIRGGKENSTNTNTAGYLGFYTLEPSVALAERMRITSTGSVGIGTTSPFAKLSVAGSAYFGGHATATNLTATGTLTVASLTGPLQAVSGIVSATSTISSNFLDANVILSSEIDTVAEIETLAGGVNLLTATEIDTSSELAGIVTDETGSGTLVFGTNATLASTTLSGNTLLTNATTTSLGVTTICFTGDTCRTSWPTAASAFGQSWEIANGALSPTTTLGINVHASSTIGAGTTGQGLTVFGSATTTGNAYFGGNIGVGTQSPAELLHVFGSDATIRVGNSTDSNSYSTFSDVSATQLLLSKTTSSGAPIIDIAPIPSDGSSNATLRFFRTTNTTGGVALTILRGDNTTSVNTQLGGNTNSYFNALTGNVGIGTTSPFAKFSVSGTAYIGGNLTATGTIFAANGLVGTPSYSFTNDTDSGFYADGSDNIFIGTGGTRRFFVDTGLSANSSSGARLISGATSATVPSLIPNRSDTTAGIGAASAGVVSIITGGTERLQVSNTGNIGIATTSPFTPLSVAGSAYIGGNLTATGTVTFSGLSDGPLQAVAGVLSATSTIGDAYINDAITLSGGTIGSNNISGTLTTTGTLTIGDNGDRIDIASSGWDVTNSVFTGGTWQGNVIGTTYGGTGIASTPNNGELLIGDGLGYTLGTITGGSGLTVTNGAGTIDIDCDVASGTVAGCLSTTDWSIFNNKISSTSIDTSSELASLLTDETGTAGNLVFSTLPTLQGFLSNASSTIGNGTAQGGLTVYGNATTTGNAYIAGNLGIGTPSPTFEFELVGTSGDTGLMIDTPSGTDIAYRFRENGSSKWAWGYEGTSESLRFGTGTDVDSTTNMKLTLESNGNVDVGTTTGYSKLSVWGSGTGTGKLFGLVNNASTTVMQALDNGNVGIGTANPGSNLVVSGPSAYAQIVTTATNGSTLLNFDEADNGFTHSFFIKKFGSTNATPGIVQFWNTDNADMVFATNNKAQARITAAGNFGLGTTSPFTKLSVAGSAYIGGNLTATGTVTFTGLSDGCVNVASGVLGSTACGGSSSFGKTWEITNGALSPTTTVGIGVYASSTIGAGTQQGGLTVYGGATTTGNAYFGGKVSLGSTTPYAKLSIYANNGETNKTLFAIGSSTASAVTTHFAVMNTGNVGIGTSTPAENLVISGINANGISGPILRMVSTGVTSNNSALKFSGPGGEIGFVGADYNGSGAQDIHIGTTQSSGLLRFFSGALQERMRVTSSGDVGIGTTTPYARLSVWATSTADTSKAFEVANSASSTLFAIFNDGDIFMGSTTATTTLAGGLSINNGAVLYDYSTNQTSIENLNLGPISFDTDAGAVSWIDMPVSASAPNGTTESYSAQIDSNALLTVWAQSNGSGGITKSRVVIGTSTDAVLGSTNIPFGSFIVADGIICVDDSAGNNCDDGARTRGQIYAESSSVTAIDLAENYPTLQADLGPGEVVMLDTQDAEICTNVDTANGPATCLASSTDSVPFVARAARASTTPRLLGIVSTEPGVLLGGFASDELLSYRKVPVALSGRVPLKVNIDNGEIKAGDQLTLSETPGVAMKAATTSPIIAIALEGFDGTKQAEATTTGPTTGTTTIKTKPGEGVIVAFVHLEQQEGLSQLALDVESIKQQLALLTGTTTALGGQTFDVSVLEDTATTTFAQASSTVGILESALTGLESGIGFARDFIAARFIAVERLFASVITFLPGGTLEVPEGENEASGTGVIITGTTEVTILNTLVTPTSKIFVTPTTLTNVPLVVTEKEEGIGFTIRIGNPQAEDITFDWFLIQSYSTGEDSEVIVPEIPEGEIPESNEGDIATGTPEVGTTTPDIGEETSSSTPEVSTGSSTPESSSEETSSSTPETVVEEVTDEPEETVEDEVIEEPEVEVTPELPVEEPEDPAPQV